MAVLVSNDFPPAHGGIQRYIERLAASLYESNARVVVVAPSADGSDLCDAALPYPVRRYPGRGRLASFVGMFASLLRERLVHRREATIASIWFPGGLAAMLIPRPLRGRLVVIAHGSEIAPSRGGPRRAIMRWVLRHADVVAANSSFTAQLLAAVGVSRNVQVIPCGVDPADPPAPRTGGPPTVLAVGRLVRRKGFDRLIEALPAVRREIAEARLVIIGDGPQRAELETLAGQSPARDHIELRGSVDDAGLRASYAEATVFALPVRRVADDVEGFGIVYLEAAMAQLPAIGGRNSGAVDAIAHGDTGLVVDGDDAGAIAEAIVDLLRDRDRAVRMGQAGRKRALEAFSWTANASAIRAALDER